jgi:hypothetical protein
MHLGPSYFIHVFSIGIRKKVLLLVSGEQQSTVLLQLQPFVMIPIIHVLNIPGKTYITLASFKKVEIFFCSYRIYTDL